MSASPSSSEIIDPFPKEPVDISEFFISSVRRLMHDNLDFVVTDSWGTKSMENLYLIDRNPAPGLLRYHYLYESTDTSTGVNEVGMYVETPHLPERTKYTHPGEPYYRYWAQRKGSSRHYRDTNQGLGVVAMTYKVPGQLFLDPLEGKIEDPVRIDDPLDPLKVHTLKADIEAMKSATPIKPRVNLIRHFVTL